MHEHFDYANDKETRALKNYRRGLKGKTNGIVDKSRCKLLRSDDFSLNSVLKLHKREYKTIEAVFKFCASTAV